MDPTGKNDWIDENPLFKPEQVQREIIQKLHHHGHQRKALQCGSQMGRNQ